MSEGHDEQGDPEAAVPRDARLDLVRGAREDQVRGAREEGQLLEDAGRLPCRFGVVEGDGGERLLRDLDLVRIASDRPAVPRENVALADHVGVVDAEVVPDVGVARDVAKKHALAAAADEERQAALHGLRVAHGVAHREVPAVEGGALLGPHPAEDLERLAQLCEPRPDRRERIAVLLVLDLVPAGAEADDQPAATHLVEGGRHLREEGGRPVAHAEHELSDAHAPGDRGGRHRLRPCLEQRDALVRAIDEVIDHPDRVEAGLVRGLGHLARLVPGGAELRQADAEPYPCVGHGQLIAPAAPGGNPLVTSTLRYVRFAARTPRARSASTCASRERNASTSHGFGTPYSWTATPRPRAASSASTTPSTSRQVCGDGTGWAPPTPSSRSAASGFGPRAMSVARARRCG